MTPIPARMARLPRDKHGRPIPWFVLIDEHGTPDFRVIRSHGIEDAYRFRWCWTCGQPLGRHSAFVIGPMCAVNRVSAEPPSHRECAIYSAVACPFLSTPNMVRRDRGLPDHVDPPGVMLLRNPGVAVVWGSRGGWRPERVPDGVLFNVGDPTEVLWFAHGRPATVEEIHASITAGLPALREVAEKQGPLAVAELDRQLAVALRLLPAVTITEGRLHEHGPIEPQVVAHDS
jgi:hypothetical protein